MLLTVNQIFAWHDDDSGEKWDERVLHIFAETGEVVVIDTKAKDALPVFRSMKDLEEAVEKSEAIPLDGDPYKPQHYTEEELESKKLRKSKRHRDKALRIIAPLFTPENSIPMLFAQDRAALISARLQETRSSWPKEEQACEKMLYTYCRRWWQGGQLPNAVLPRYHNCGARRDKPRNIKKKLGRPSRLTKHSSKNGGAVVVTGANMTSEWVEKIKLGGRLFYEQKLKPSFSWAYRQTLERFFIKDKLIENGKETVIVPDAVKGEIFTKGQFRYYYLLHRDHNRALQKRAGPTMFKTRHRRLMGKHKAKGPGYRYLIDAMIADVYLVSRYGSRLIVGRPIVWAVIDLYSRMITGVCVRLEGEGWLGLQLALENTVEDKVEFCAKYGIRITADQWPARHRPVAILGDRGPLISKQIHRFINAFNVTVANTPPYRPDWKGVIERLFGEMNIRVFKWLPGHVTPGRDPSDPDYRLAAVLNIEELTAIIIEAVLHHNNECLIADGVEIDPKFLIAGLEPYPTQLFTWGAQYRPGGLRETDFNAVRRSLLPEGQISINKGEIKFRHPKAPKPLTYISDQLVDKGLLLRQTGLKGRKFTTLYDVRWANEIYLLPKPGSDLITCRLRDADSIHLNRDWAEIIQYMEEIQVQRDLLGSDVIQSEINFDRQMRERVSKANLRRKKFEESAPSASKSSLISAIKTNRKMETEHIHQTEANQRQTGTPLAIVKSRQGQSQNNAKRNRGPQITNIAELRKKRMGR